MLTARMQVLTLCLFAGLTVAAGPIRVTTSQYDNARHGANLGETALSPRNVNVRQFGKLFSLPVDGDVYAQPLYLPHVDIPGKGIHDVLFVATEHDSVYAFDADSAAPAQLWHANLLPQDGVSRRVSDVAVACEFLGPEVGITSTPVIDTETGTLYVLARSRKGSDFSQHLHALAITTGAEKFGGPVQIRARVAGSGAGSSWGELEFNAQRENPRAALLLCRGTVYLTWASSCDVGPYHGWVMAYDARTLRQQAVFNTSPNAAESGIWMSDTGPVADEQGHVYVVTGNGVFRASEHNYGDTVLKLSLRGSQLVVAGSFTPFDQEYLNSTDGDLGSGGPLLLPGGLVFGGKAGVLYTIDPQRMYGLQRKSQPGSALTIGLSDGIFSAPAYWNGHLYTFAANDELKDFVVTAGRPAKEPEAASSFSSRFSGGTPTVSANGTKDGVVWIVETRDWNVPGDRAVLHAYDALNVARELYDSHQNARRDEAGEAVRFVIPMVANGRVFVGVKKAVEVYGLLSH